MKRVTAPRYAAEYDYHNSVAAALMLDGGGRRRDGDFPALWRGTTNQQGRAAWSRQAIGGYVGFNPNPTRDQSGRPFLAEMGQHPHGFVSPLVYFFTEDWILVRLRAGDRTETIAFECGPSPDPKRQPSDSLIDADGKSANNPTNGVAIAAWFRPSGDGAGLAQFCPPEAKWSDGRVVQPGHTAMAFTWCRDTEFADLFGAWRAFVAPTVKPQQQGDVRN